MSGDSKEQPNIFYTKVPQNEAHDTLLCRKLVIIPVEVIVRNIAAGGIVRQTTLSEGTIIQPSIVEYFLLQRIY